MQPHARALLSGRPHVHGSLSSGLVPPRHARLLGSPRMAGRVLTPTVEVPITEDEYCFVTAHLQVRMPDISPDSTVKIIGSCGALGNWQAGSAPSLQRTFGDLWSADIGMPPGAHVFKVVVMDQPSLTEEDNNKVLQVPEMPGWLRVSVQWGSSDVVTSFLPEELPSLKDTSFSTSSSSSSSNGTSSSVPAETETNGLASATAAASSAYIDASSGSGTAATRNRSRRASRSLRGDSPPTSVRQEQVEAMMEEVVEGARAKGRGSKSKSPTAYHKFVGDALRQLKEERPDVPHRERMRLVNEMWRSQKESLEAAGATAPADAEPAASERTRPPARPAPDREEVVKAMGSRWSQPAAPVSIGLPPAADQPSSRRDGSSSSSSSDSSRAVAAEPPAVTRSGSSSGSSSSREGSPPAAAVERARVGTPSRAGSPARSGSPTRGMRPERSVAPQKPQHPFEVFAQEQTQVLKAMKPKMPQGEINKEIEDLWGKVPSSTKDAKMNRYYQQQAVYEAWLKANEVPAGRDASGGETRTPDASQTGTVTVDKSTGTFMAPDLKVRKHVPDTKEEGFFEGPFGPARAAGFSLLGLAAAALVVQGNNSPVPALLKKWIPINLFPQNNAALQLPQEVEDEEEYTPVPTEAYATTAAPVEVDERKPAAAAGAASEEEQAASAAEEGQRSEDMTAVGQVASPAEVLEEAADDDDAVVAAPGEDAAVGSMAVDPTEGPEGGEEAQADGSTDVLGAFEGPAYAEDDAAGAEEAADEPQEVAAVASPDAEEDEAQAVSGSPAEEEEEAGQPAVAEAEEEEEQADAAVGSISNDAEEDEAGRAVASAEEEAAPLGAFERMFSQEDEKQEQPAMAAATEDEEEEQQPAMAAQEQEEEEEEEQQQQQAADAQDEQEVIPAVAAEGEEEEEAPAWSPVFEDSLKQEDDQDVATDAAEPEMELATAGTESAGAEEQKTSAAALGLRREVAAPCLATIINSILTPEGATASNLPRDVAEPCLQHITSILTPPAPVEEVAAAEAQPAEEELPGWSPVLDSLKEEETQQVAEEPVTVEEVVPEEVLAVPAAVESTLKGSIPTTNYGPACTCPPAK